MKRDESWRQRRLSMPTPTAPRPRSDGEEKRAQRLAERAMWNAPDEGTAPAPRWATAMVRDGEPGEPVEPTCRSGCPWYMNRSIVNTRARLAGGSSVGNLPARCMHPVRQGADTADLHSWCWPAYIDIWRRASAGEEAG